MPSSVPAPLALVDHLTVRYGTRVALDDVALAIQPGTTTAVIGSNGSGKSTLLGAIAGLRRPTGGRVVVDRSQVALVLQTTTVDPTLPLTVADAVRMGRYRARGLFGRIKGRDDQIVHRSMERTGVADLAGRQLHELSGGQRQRALVAQGLAQEADLLLLDEPATGLDVTSREVILDVMDQERDAGRSVVMTTHGLEDAARCDRVVLLARRVVAEGTPAQVMTDDHLTAAFGGAVVRLGERTVFLDDPHHGHDHGHDHSHG